MSEPTRLSQHIDDAPQTNEAFHQWLRTQMNSERKWLLAHADDGVIWGRWSGGEIITSHDVAPHVSPPLRLITLQQAFIFGKQDEMRLWREEQGWLARRISNANGADFIEEAQILWGDEAQELPVGKDQLGFTHVRERKQQGMDHIVPIVVTQAELSERKLKLRVCHFITYDEHTGEARIALSRLVGLEPDPQESEK